jgi:hypothetical protein
MSVGAASLVDAVTFSTTIFHGWKPGLFRTSDGGVPDVTPFLKSSPWKFVLALTSPSIDAFASQLLVWGWRWGFIMWSRRCYVSGCGSTTIIWGEPPSSWTRLIWRLGNYYRGWGRGSSSLLKNRSCLTCGVLRLGDLWSSITNLHWY